MRAPTEAELVAFRLATTLPARKVQAKPYRQEQHRPRASIVLPLWRLGFQVREIEKITGISRAAVGRIVKGVPRCKEF